MQSVASMRAGRGPIRSSAWAWPHAPAVKIMPDEKALQWADRFWQAELDSGGG